MRKRERRERERERRERERERESEGKVGGGGTKVGQGPKRAAKDRPFCTTTLAKGGGGTEDRPRGSVLAVKNSGLVG
jgi:hypothetical protein